MSEIPFYLLAFIVVLGVLIVVHEFGHYLAARWCGVRVLRFSVGFGRALWRRRLGKDGTEWAIGIFPLGGYVKMLDEREDEVAPDELHRSFNRQSVGKRSLIVAAGPAANFALAIVLYWAIFMYGSNEMRPILGTPPAASPAAIAGIVNGEEVRSVDGQPVATWNDLRWILLQKAAAQERAELEVINEQREIAIRRLPLQAAGEEGWEGDALGRLGIRFFRPNVPPVVGKVMPGSPGEAAGIRSGDTVLAVGGTLVPTWYDFVLQVRDAAERPLRIELSRNGQIVAVDVVPVAISEHGKRIGRIGVAVAETPDTGQGACGDLGQVGVQPGDVGQDADRRGFVAQPFGAGEHRRLRRPVGAPWHRLLPQVHGPDQHQPWGSQSAPDTGSGRGAFDVSCARSCQAAAALSAGHGDFPADWSLHSFRRDGFRLFQ